MMYKCPDNIEELEELEKLLPLCRKDLYAQAKARIDGGSACSLSEVSRQLGDELGRNPNSIRRSLQREQEEGATLSHITQKYVPDTIATKWTGDPESYTPVKYVEMSRIVMGSINTDPASNDFAQQIVLADTYYTEKDDGLTKSWDGNIFLNPPYSYPLVNYFIEKLLEELDDSKQAILLTNNNTDTKWFHMAAKKAAAVCFTSGRINFYKADLTTTSPTNGQTFFYFGNNKDGFKQVFSEVGLIMEVM